MHVWVIVLPCSRQETLLPMELWNIFEHLMASFLYAEKAYS